MAITGKQYVDLEGLSKFKELLVGKYTDGTYTVMTATNATNAEIATNYKTADGSASIKDALDSKADSSTLTTEVNKLVPKTTTIAGVDLQDNITASELITALDNESKIVNVIETVKVRNNGETEYSELTVKDKAVQIDLSGYAKTSDITSVLQFKGTKDYKNQLPTEGVKVGDVWHVRYSGSEGTSGLNAEYVYINGGWEELGPVVDFSAYYTKTETDNAITKAVGDAKTEITSAYQTADTDLQAALQGKIDALYKVVADGTDTGTIAGRLDAVETKATNNASAIATLKGGEGVEGSVAKAIKDKIDALDSSSSVASDTDVKGDYVYSVNQTDGKVAVKTASFSGSVASGDANAVTGGAVATYVTGAIGDLDVANIGSAGSFISAVGETDGKVHATTTAFATSVKADTTEADNIASNEHAVRQAIDGAYEMITSIPLEGASGSIASIFAIVSKTRELITRTIEVAESDSVTSIADYAFMGCQELTSISFPVATSIGEMAFQDCSALTTLYIGTELDTVCTLSDTNAFTGCVNLTNIYVPEALVNSYKTASNWSSFADKIKAYTGV